MSYSFFIVYKVIKNIYLKAIADNSYIGNLISISNEKYGLYIRIIISINHGILERYKI